jgi:hypothetical protein
MTREPKSFCVRCLNAGGYPALRFRPDGSIYSEWKRCRECAASLTPEETPDISGATQAVRE